MSYYFKAFKPDAYNICKAWPDKVDRMWILDFYWSQLYLFIIKFLFNWFNYTTLNTRPSSNLHFKVELGTFTNGRQQRPCRDGNTCFVLRNLCRYSSSWMVRVQVSGEKLVRSTAEMILWSMILILLWGWTTWKGYLNVWMEISSLD